jgi:uncharacterized protein YqiB (DUF1249 family)
MIDQHFSQNAVFERAPVHELLTRWTDRGLWLWLMELYENNYSLLRTLLGSLKDLPETWFSYRDDGILVILKARNLGPYTTEIEYRFTISETLMQAKARLYHDAKICEISCVAMSACSTTKGLGNASQGCKNCRSDLSVLEKWTLNYRFHRWLEYGLTRRHFASRPLIS